MHILPDIGLNTLGHTLGSDFVLAELGATSLERLPLSSGSMDASNFIVGGGSSQSKSMTTCPKQDEQQDER